MEIPISTKTWLLNQEQPFIKYNAYRFFDEQAEQTWLENDPFIQQNIERLQHWDKEPIDRHSKPDLFIHRLALLADLGVTHDVAGISPIIDAILDRCDDDGFIHIPILIPKVFGGSNEVSQSWIICDFPVILYALLKMQVEDPKLDKAMLRLAEMATDQGILCQSSIPKFKGPGNRKDMCPYATLLVCKAFGESALYRNSDAAEKTIHALAGHWEKRIEKKYFMFGIGTDFQKLKFPLVWYNLLHILYAFRHHTHFHPLSEIKEMRSNLANKANENYQFQPESMYRIFKDQDFSNKKQPSPTLTLFCLQVLKDIDKGIDTK